MTELWIATGNEKKRVELDRLLRGVQGPDGEPFTIRTLAEAPGEIEIVEDGETFADNAEIKATTLANAVGALAIGDDSGLCVDALDGRPGVRSARYAGPDATDADRIDKLLGELQGASTRAAHFTCSVCLADSGGVLARFEDHCQGTIAAEPRGEGGFGYDPAFLPVEFETSDDAPSFAQLTPEQKDSISHRGRALRQLVEHLRQTPRPAP